MPVFPNITATICNAREENRLISDGSAHLQYFGPSFHSKCTTARSSRRLYLMSYFAIGWDAEVDHEDLVESGYFLATALDIIFTLQ